MKIENIIISLLVLFSVSIYSQNKIYTLKKISKKKVVLYKNKKAIDTISTYGMKNKNTFLKIIDNEIVMSNYKVSGIANFSEPFISVSRWKIINDKLVGNSIRVTFDGCIPKKVRLYIKNNKIHWIYKKSFFKRSKGIIANEVFKLKKYIINCQ